MCDICPCVKSCPKLPGNRKLLLGGSARAVDQSSKAALELNSVFCVLTQPSPSREARTCCLGDASGTSGESVVVQVCVWNEAAMVALLGFAVGASLSSFAICSVDDPHLVEAWGGMAKGRNGGRLKADRSRLLEVDRMWWRK